MRRASLLLIAFLALWTGLATAADRNIAVSHSEVVPSERRVALVIGNSNYETASLKNPVNDAHDMTARLRALGFEVVERTDLRVKQIGSTLREFRSKLVPGSVALVFYAGHGLQIRGENFLPTVDADIGGEEDVPNQTMAVRQILDTLEDAKTRLNLVFLDACRNNPYARRFRSSDGGLARLSAPSGTLISFATRPGSVAADGSGRNGLYTQYLLQAMDIPNQPIEQVLKRVVSGVKAASQGRQEPWMEGSIEGDFYFLTTQNPAASADRRVEDEALRKASEQSARENAELKAALQAQKQESERQVQEALRRAHEQAARERAELQATMEAMLKETLARQNAAIEAQRDASKSAAEPPQHGDRPAIAPPATKTPAPDAPTTIAAIKPAAPAVKPDPTAGRVPEQPSAKRGVQVGDVFEYVANDLQWGKKRQLTAKVVAVTDAGVLEEVAVNGSAPSRIVSGGETFFSGAGIDAGFIAPLIWKQVDGLVPGQVFNFVPALNVPDCLGACARVKVVGAEEIEVAAGRFPAVKVDVQLTITWGTWAKQVRSATVWYAKETGRLLKQHVRASEALRLSAIDEVMELSVHRHTH